MKISDIKKHLANAQVVTFQLPDGTFVPEHFHVTEVGVVNKHFIDCGGTERREQVANFQLWNANDTEHRLKPEKILNIIALSEKILNMQDLEIEVEYQSNTIGKYHLNFDGTNFLLVATQTNCLAQDKCGIPTEKLKVNLVDLSNNTKGSCAPGGKCC